MSFKPMLACKIPDNLSSLPYPLLASSKLDGIRCIVKDGVALSRTLKPIRNRYIQAILGRQEFNGLDGELIVGDPTAKDCMSRTNSGVMSIEGEPDFTYHIFDIWNRPGVQYREALTNLEGRPKEKHIELLPQIICHNTAAVETLEQCVLDDGYEGLILRRPDGLYKYGRSTTREGYLFKLKRFIQDEAIVIGCEPLQHNDNDPELNALGYTQRSTAQAGKIDLPLLGAVVVKGMYQDMQVIFNIGTGFTFDERALLWEKRQDLIGKIVSYKYFPVGCKDRPRHPVFVSFRDPSDL
jgi:DNA ligase-1